MMKKVCCFGEMMLRLSPESGGNWIRQNNMPVYIAGAELNVASALARWKFPVKYCTAVPSNHITREITDHLSSLGIDLSSVDYSGNRLGVYYLPGGTDLKNAGVIYDRAGSSFSAITPGHLNWKEIFSGCTWFHFSAINPALNENVTAVCHEAIKVAKELKLTISIDLNYRSKLWQYGKKPIDVMPGLVENCDVVMGNIWSVSDLLGIPVDPSVDHVVHAKQTAAEIFRKYKACKMVANTFRFTEKNSVKYFATLDERDTQYVSPTFTSNQVAGKVGSGDCFMAGLIYGINKEFDKQHTVGFAAAAAFGKLHEKGDATEQTVEQVEQTLKKHGTRTVHN